MEAIKVEFFKKLLRISKRHIVVKDNKDIGKVIRFDD